MNQFLMVMNSIVTKLPQSSEESDELLDVDQELSAEQTYRETLCGVRSFMG